MIKKELYLNDIIINTAKEALKIQKADGSFPAGHNGPWKQEDTPVRVTAHWGILLLKAFTLNNIQEFKQSAAKAYSYLSSEKLRPSNYSYHCIQTDNEVAQCNGLIGQAWVIESLIDAYLTLDDSSYLDIAESLILKHNFDKNLCLWNVLGINGKILRIHRTFNQQLWFSVMAYKTAKLRKNKVIMSCVNMFFEKLPQFMEFKKYIKMHIKDEVFLQNTNLISKYKKKISNIQNKKYFNKMSKGYLSFSLLGLSELYIADKNNDIWNDVKIKEKILKSINFLDKKIFYEDSNEFSFQYNPVGFEVALIKERFSEYLGDSISQDIDRWIFKQLFNHFDFTKMLMVKNTTDNNTLASRIYEITRLQNRLTELK